MKLRTRTRLIIVATLAIFLALLGLVTQSVILQSFGVIEEQETTSHVQRFISQLNNEIEDVAITCRDWANRKEIAVFNPEPGGSGDPGEFFQPVFMKNLGIDYIIIYDAAGHRIFSETIPGDGEYAGTAPAGLDEIVHDSILPEVMPGGISGRRGISSIQGNPVILAGYPIAGGEPDASAGGTLVMARLLDPGRIDEINRMLQLEGALVPAAPQGNGILSPEEWEIAKDGAIISRSSGENEQDGFAVITGIENKPSFLLLKIETGRPVYQQVRQSILIAASALILLGIVFLIVVQLLLRRYILAPLGELDNGMKSIGSSGDLDLRIPETGDEEILSLTRSFNRMLGEIRHQRDELHELLEEIGQQRDDLNEARQELAGRNRDLLELNRKANLYLDIYLDVLTYEILNAIMGLRGYAEILRESDGKKERALAEKIVALAKKSDDVIRNIGTISRLYKSPPEVGVLNLCDVLWNAKASWPGVEIRVGECDVPVLANGMLSAVFDNIFANSLKYGGKDVQIAVEAKKTGAGMIEVIVTDNGPGISDSMKPLIFDRFAKNTTIRSSYGLGLHIVKMLVEGYGGTVRAGDRIEGDPANGAAIHFTLRTGERSPGDCA